MFASDRPRRSSWIELEETWSDEQPVAGCEEKTGRRDDVDAAELHRADLVALGVEHVSEGVGERDPQVTAAVDGCRAHGRSHDRELAVPPRPGRREGRDDAVGFGPLHLALEQQAAVAVVLAEHRNTGMKHVEESAGRIDERYAAIQREMQIPVAFVSRRAQLPERPALATGRRVLRDERAVLGL